MKKRNKTLLEIVSGIIFIISAIYAINRLIFFLASRKERLYSSNGAYYKHKHGRIFYTKQGSGSPLLLVHDLSCTGSDYEWSKVVKQFSMKHTVYTLDLLGCGRSDKPRITYTAFIYTQILRSFVNEIIGAPTDVIALGYSVPILMMTERMNPGTFSKFIFVNPLDFKKANVFPTYWDERKKSLCDSPIIGTFLYCCATTKTNILRKMKKEFVFPTSHLSHAPRFYEAAHKQGSNAKYLYNSLKYHFLACDILHNYTEVSVPCCIIFGHDHEYDTDITDWDIFLNPDTEVAIIPDTCYYPQLEQPVSFVDICETYLQTGTIE